MAKSRKDALDENAAGDYWVVNDDRVARVRVPRRYHLFYPESCSLPVPLDYLDVLRFTDTNVKGQSTLVDCWVSDPNSDQAKGPWVGKTAFNIRMPIPKKGWAIQMGDPPTLKNAPQGPYLSG